MQTQVLGLYRTLLKEARKFNNYNFRNHAIRKTKWEFKHNKNLSDVKKIQDKYIYGKQQLDILKRQVILGQLYPEGQSIMEVS
jgi:hypothetical protein